MSNDVPRGAYDTELAGYRLASATLKYNSFWSGLWINYHLD